MDEIVIAGISGRLPESDNLEEFWENLINGVDMVTEDDRRWTPGQSCNVESLGLNYGVVNYICISGHGQSKIFYLFFSHSHLLIYIGFISNSIQFNSIMC